MAKEGLSFKVNGLSYSVKGISGYGAYKSSSNTVPYIIKGWSEEFAKAYLKR